MPWTGRVNLDHGLLDVRRREQQEGASMTNRTIETSPLVYARAAGVLYLIIIVLGLFGEIFVRSSIISPGDTTATARNILGAEGLFRAGFLADSVMLLSDVALAVLLFALLKPVNKTLPLSRCFFG